MKFGVALKMYSLCVVIFILSVFSILTGIACDIYRWNLLEKNISKLKEVGLECNFAAWHRSIWWPISGDKMVVEKNQVLGRQLQKLTIIGTSCFMFGFITFALSGLILLNKITH